MSTYIIDVPNLLEEWDYEKNEELGITPDSLKLCSNKGVWWKCGKGHSFKLSPAKRTKNNQNCYYCSNRRLLVGFNDFKTCYPDDAADWDYDANPDKPEDYTFVSLHMANWKCKVCGNKWSSKIRDKVRANWSGCKVCAAKKRGELRHKQIIEKTGGITDPLLLREWDYERNEKGPEEYAPHSNEYAFWICSKCGFRYESKISNRTSLGRGCPACANLVVWPGHNDLATTHPEIAKEWHPTLNGDLKPDQVVHGTAKKVWWRCPKGHSYQASILHRTTPPGTNCPICNSGRQTSFAEQAVYYYIKKKFPDAISRYTDIFDNGMELDIYIPSLKLGIEYDGEAWHKGENIERERLKWKICQENGIKLKRLKEKHARGEMIQADSILSIPGGMYKPDKLEQLIRVLLDDLDPESNMWTRRDPLHFHSSVDINIKRDELEIRNYMTDLGGVSLKELYPEVAAEWHPTLNGNLKPEMFKPKSGFKAWWRCPVCGHEYQATIQHRTSGTGCKICRQKNGSIKNSKRVQMIDINTGDVIREFVSVAEASRQMHISHGNISAACRGERRQASGYLWKYCENMSLIKEGKK